MLVMTHNVLRSSNSRDDSIYRCDSIKRAALILQHHWT